MDTMFEGKQQKVEITIEIKQIPQSVGWWSNVTALWLKKKSAISLSMDEFTDTTDDAQLMLFVRYYDEPKREFVEDVLGRGQTRGEYI